MFITIINDCRDGNAMGRQATRLATFFPGAAINGVGIANYTEIEAAGNLIDMLDASGGEEGIILVNAAPRHKKQWPNGTPFGYFWYKKTLVITTVDGYTLSLVKKLGLIDSLQLTEVPTVVDAMIAKGLLDENLRERIVKTQFRSYEYTPRLAKWVWDKIEVPSTEYSLSEVPDVPAMVWWVDNFSDVKTTMLPEDVGHEPGKVIQTKVGEIECFTRMKDVPVGTPAITIGSSGIGDKRFLEIIVLGGRGGDHFNLKPGDEIF